MTTPTTYWGPHDATFNGMVQLVVAPDTRDWLRAEGPCLLIKENVLTEEQAWHHITLAYKPTCGEVERLVGLFHNEHYTCTFHPHEVRASPGICAVFGEIKRTHVHGHDVRLPGFRLPSCLPFVGPRHHITIGADEGHPPKESNKLLTEYATCTAWERYPDLPKAFGLYFNVTDFTR